MKRSFSLAGALVVLVGCSDRSVVPPSQHEAPKVAASAPAQPQTRPEPVIYSVGGDVRPPLLIQRAEPLFPRDAKCRGLVLLEAVIDARGRPTEVRDLSRSPDAFTQAHATALAASRFRPAMRLGQPVAVRYSVTVSSRCL